MKPVAKEMKEDLLVKTAELQYHSITFPFKLAVSVPKNTTPWILLEKEYDNTKS